MLWFDRYWFGESGSYSEFFWLSLKHFIDVRSSYRFSTKSLTLIVPGEVKVDLANFDIKFWTKFLCIGLYIKIPIPAPTSSESFWTSDISKNYVLTSIMKFFRQKSGRGDLLPTTPPPFCLVFLLLMTTWGWEKSCHAVVLSLVQCQSGFQSVSRPGLRRVRGDGGFSVWMAL